MKKLIGDGVTLIVATPARRWRGGRYTGSRGWPWRSLFPPTDRDNPGLSIQFSGGWPSDNFLYGYAYINPDGTVIRTEAAYQANYQNWLNLSKAPSDPRTNTLGGEFYNHSFRGVVPCVLKFYNP